MILSAIGLPMPGQSFVNLPTPAPDRAEGVQAVGAAVAPGGAGRTRDADTDAGGNSGRQAARDEARVIRLEGRSPGRPADAIAGPQPAFEIAVLEKLREDAMRVPPEDAGSPSVRPGDEPVRDSRTRSADSATAPEGAGTPRMSDDEGEPRETGRAEARDRAREPADEGFDDARRMSEEPSPPRIDVTR